MIVLLQQMSNVFSIMVVLMAAVYAVAVLFLFVYSISQAYLLWQYLSRRQIRDNVLVSSFSSLPPVTVQLPVYNEKYVIARLIDAAAQISYPLDKLEIQVLDDSTDETTMLAEKKVKEWRMKGVNIRHLHRLHREGFKAGALAAGLQVASGHYIAVFDADFIPPSDFLEKTLPHFCKERVGMVQTRWEHVNSNYSLLTAVQAFALNAHFRVEQAGRHAGGCFINFNGTAGIWRKDCILDAGGWQADTLTEDLDLSYRAQLKGWQFVYLEEVTSPAELPPVMQAYKLQQYRWTKGGAETARKHFRALLSADLPLLTKWQALAHLFNSAAFVAVIVCALLSVPLLWLKQSDGLASSLFGWMRLLQVSFLIMALIYIVSSLSGYPHKGSRMVYFLRTFPLFLFMQAGLSLHNAIAVLEGYWGRRTPFVRTPKFNIVHQKDDWRRNQYLPAGLSGMVVFELFLCLYFLTGILAGLHQHDWSLLPFHSMLFVGFGMVVFFSIAQSVRIFRQG